MAFYMDRSGTLYFRHFHKTLLIRGSSLVTVLVVTLVSSVILGAGLFWVKNSIYVQGLNQKKIGLKNQLEGQLNVARLSLIEEASDIFTNAVPTTLQPDVPSVSNPETLITSENIDLPISNAELEISFPTTFDGQNNPLKTGSGEFYYYVYTLTVSESRSKVGAALRSTGVIKYVLSASPFGEYSFYGSAFSLPPIGDDFSAWTSCLVDWQSAQFGIYENAPRQDWVGKIHFNGEPFTNYVCGLGGQPSFPRFFSIQEDGSFNSNTDGIHMMHKFTNAHDQYVHHAYSLLTGGWDPTLDTTISSIPGSAPYLLPSLASYSYMVMEEGFEYESNSFTFPSNANSLENAALTDIGLVSTPSNEDRRSALGLPVNSNPVPNGVYVAHDTNDEVTGGIYAKGCIQDLHLEKLSGERQRYRFTQCGGGSTFDVIVDYDDGTTSINSTTYNGIPGSSVFVDGEVRKLHGPNAQPALHRDTRATITSTQGNIVLTDSLIYEDDPETVPDAENILGIVAMDGGIATCDDSCAGGKHYIYHASLMALKGPASGIMWKSDIPSVNSFSCTHIGSMIGKYIGLHIGSWGSNTYGCDDSFRSSVDPRAFDGIYPPYFPTYGAPIPSIEFFELRKSLVTPS